MHATISQSTRIPRSFPWAITIPAGGANATSAGRLSDPPIRRIPFPNSTGIGSTRWRRNSPRRTPTRRSPPSPTEADRYRLARVADAWRYYRTFLLGKLNYANREDSVRADAVLDDLADQIPEHFVSVFVPFQVSALEGNVDAVLVADRVGDGGAIPTTDLAGETVNVPTRAATPLTSRMAENGLVQQVCRSICDATPESVSHPSSISIVGILT